jgi:transporter family-2 protein
MRSGDEQSALQAHDQPMARVGDFGCRGRYFFIAVFVVRSKPLPSAQDAGSMPWWAVIGGLVGAVQVYAGLTLVHRVGAGVFIGLTVTAALIMSLLVDHFGWLRVHPHPISLGRVTGGLLLICGVALISKF